jgi:hypothetical protein
VLGALKSPARKSLEKVEEERAEVSRGEPRRVEER